MGRGVTLNVEIPKYVMKELNRVVKVDKRPLPLVVRDLFNIGLEQWMWGKLVDDMVEHVKTHNPSQEEKDAMLQDFAGLVHDVVEGGQAKKGGKEA